jgi:hypothetical protein
VKYDILPCNVEDFMVQNRRFSSANLIHEGNNGLCPKSIPNVRFIIHSTAKNIIIPNFVLLLEKIRIVGRKKNQKPKPNQALRENQNSN